MIMISDVIVCAKNMKHSCTRGWRSENKNIQIVDVKMCKSKKVNANKETVIIKF